MKVISCELHPTNQIYSELVELNKLLRMKESQRSFHYKNTSVFTRIFLPDNEPVAIIHIIHGLAEHSGRYQDFSEFMTKQGYAVYVHDHPGHGFTKDKSIGQGHLPGNNGWSYLLDTMYKIHTNIKTDYPDMPVFIMGHSMGSLLTRHYSQLYPTEFSGMILSGTSNPGFSKLLVNLLIIKFLAIFNKSSRKIKWLSNKFYNDFNRSTSLPSTGFDWLSSDPAQVNKYIADPMCGFDLSLGFFKNLLSGTISLKKAEKKLNFRKNLPILIMSGKDDPVGNHAIDPSKLFKHYCNQGCVNVDLVLCEGRHELLNEKDKERNYIIIEQWLSKQLHSIYRNA